VDFINDEDGASGPSRALPPPLLLHLRPLPWDSFALPAKHERREFCVWRDVLSERTCAAALIASLATIGKPNFAAVVRAPVLPSAPMAAAPTGADRMASSLSDG